MIPGRHDAEPNAPNVVADSATADRPPRMDSPLVKQQAQAGRGTAPNRTWSMLPKPATPYISQRAVGRATARQYRPSRVLEERCVIVAERACQAKDYRERKRRSIQSRWGE